MRDDPNNQKIAISHDHYGSVRTVIASREGNTSFSEGNIGCTVPWDVGNDVEGEPGRVIPMDKVLGHTHFLFYRLLKARHSESLRRGFFLKPFTPDIDTFSKITNWGKLTNKQ